ncbi:JM30 [macacine gammaherpesvirus 11]|uniref:JM30 n=2 Tax=macacine gammaherpesvirus 11 TaxID=2560570 RepID=G9JM38_9GAMA|nr:JM30 [Macaca fuscata rhadinovirus]AAT00007.1 JM30 [Macaca fuscata rhadinovirus]AEW87555.1 JM30 [Macaca fuscata rhadinovirus]AEW87725.1 JM30 [Macaca fuscata rhadinovirus]
MFIGRGFVYGSRVATIEGSKYRSFSIFGRLTTSTYPPTYTEVMLGRCLREPKEMSAGLRGLMWRVIRCENLNTFLPGELRFLHLVLCEMYNYGLNVYLLKEAIANTGTRDDIVLGRKVPVEFWKIIYDGLREMGVSDATLLSETKRGALWLYFNGRPCLLKGLGDYVFCRLGLSHSVRVVPENLTDGNYLYNLGSVIPCRLLVALSYCLAFWGHADHEPWVRLFAGKIFILYLIISGHIMPRKSILEQVGTSGYGGFVEAVCRDVRAVHGIPAWDFAAAAPALTSRQTDYLFAFNNSVV